MQNISQFQSQLPLSPKKFWKKIISQLPSIFFFALVISIFFWLVVMKLVFDVEQTGIDTSKVIFAITFGTLMIIVLFLFIYGLYVSAYIKRYYYDSSDFITIKKGVFAPGEIHVQYPKIQDVYVDQDILDRILGIYDVHIASATFASGIEAHIDGVSPQTAEALKNYILGKIQGTMGATSVGAVITPSAASAGPSIINFSEEISSKTFPINSKWYIQVVIGSLVTAMLYSVIIIFVLLGKIFRNYPIANNFIFWLVLSVILFVGGIVYMVIWKANFYFAFLPQFVMQKTGVISTQEKHLPYKSIQDVMIKQSLLGRMLGLSTVVVQNAAQSGMGGSRYGRSARMNDTNIIIPGQPVEKGQKLVEELNKVLANRKDSMGL